MTALIHLLEEEGQPELLIWYKNFFCDGMEAY